LRKGIVRPAIGQGLQREYFASLLRANGNAVDNGTAKQVIHGGASAISRLMPIF
jgi:hypothetical protein